MTRLGKTELQVSRIAFGTWQVSGEWGSYDADQAQRAIRHALDLGVNFFDTAQAYGFGESEEVLANALRGELDRDRDSVVIATKGGINPGTDRPRDSRREWLRSGVESSLTAMKIDHIDLYQVHWPDTDTPFEDTAGLPAGARRRGQDPPRRRVELRRRPDGRVRPSSPGGDPAAAVPPVPPPHRGRRAPLRARARHRHARVLAAGLGAADRLDGPEHDVRGLRLARAGLGVPGREVPDRTSRSSSG